MQSVYSWYGTPIHLILRDEVADTYNRAVDAFMKAQTDHKERTGVQWDPVNEPLLIDWTDEEQKTFNDLAAWINRLIEINGDGLDIPEEQITSDYLVKL